MKLKSYIPFLTVPLSVAMLTILVVDAARGKFHPSMDMPRYLIWGILCTLWLVSGLIKWNKPYVTADDNGLTVRSRWFSNQPSFVIPWSEIKRCAGRTFWDFRVELLDGQTIKIPINGMPGNALGALSSLIETKTGNAIGIGSPLAGTPSHTTDRTDRVTSGSAVISRE
jgi:hypothetical protein